jgi:ABC-type transport system involved in Fe-S cluster assembly fused permease/ATPase subunit
MLCITGSAIVFGGTCILLMIGAQVQKQSLMIPYLIVQMLMIVMTAIVGIPIAVGLFYLKHPLYGLSVTIVVFFTSILPIYFWFTVKRAYTEIAKTGKLSMSRNKSNLECGYVKKYVILFLKF